MAFQAGGEIKTFQTGGEVEPFQIGGEAALPEDEFLASVPSGLDAPLPVPSLTQPQPERAPLDRPGLLSRAIQRAIKSFSIPPDVRSSDIKATEIQNARMKKRKKQGIRRFDEILLQDEFDDIKGQLALIPEARESEDVRSVPDVIRDKPLGLQLPTPERDDEGALTPRGVVEAGSDITVGVASFITKLVLLKKAFGGAPAVARWEALNLAEGGPVGKGAATRAVLGSISKIPALTKVGKAAKIATGGAFFGTRTAMEGGDFVDVTVSTMIGAGFQTWSIKKQTSFLKEYRKTLRKQTFREIDAKSKSLKDEVLKTFRQNLKAAKTPDERTAASTQRRAGMRGVTVFAEGEFRKADQLINTQMDKVTSTIRSATQEKAQKVREAKLAKQKQRAFERIRPKKDLGEVFFTPKVIRQQEAQAEKIKTIFTKAQAAKTPEKAFEIFRKGFPDATKPQIIQTMQSVGIAVAEELPAQPIEPAVAPAIPPAAEIRAVKPETRPTVPPKVAEAAIPEVSGFITNKITGVPYYDEIIKSPERAIQKDVEIDIVEMSPDEYLDRVTEMQKVSRARTEEMVNKESVAYKELKAAVKKGIKIDMPYLDYKRNTQEGRARAMLAKELGQETIPVLIVNELTVIEDMLPLARPAAEEIVAEPVKEEIEISKPTDIPKVPKQPVTEQKSTIDLKAKEAQIFNEAVRTQEKITAAEQGEVGIEPAGASFTDHIDTFHSYQLPATSKIPGIVHEMKVVNGRRLAGKLTPTQANKMIYNLRKKLVQTAIKEKIALRVSKIGKVRIGLRKSGVYVPDEVATYGKYKDIEPILGGGQDITRAIQQMDGSLTVKEKLRTKGQAGPIEKYVLWRTRTMSLQKLNWLKEKTIEIQDILSAAKASKKDKEINLILELTGKADRDIPIEDILSKTKFASADKETIKAAQELRQFYDDLIEEQNAARLMRGQDEIPYRQNYSPHILRDTTVWEQLFMRDKKLKDLEKADLPDYVRPNATFNPRAQAREAAIPYDKRVLSARELAESYIITASKDIFNTSIIQNNKAFIDQLRGQGLEKTAEYLAEWNATAYAGIKPGWDRAAKLPKWAQRGLRYFNRLRNMAVFPFNVAWSLSTQPLSLSNTVGRYGLSNTVQGFFQWLKPSIRRQAAQDYYSFIVKSTRRGGVTKQDASNLLGENIKIQKTVGEFVENFSTILLTEMEKLLTGMSIRAAHIQGFKRGLRGEALKNFASDGGGKTQSMYNDEDKPMILRSLLVKSAAPYQTYAFEVANTFREWAGKTGTPPDTKLYAMWSVTRWLAALIVLRMIANTVRRRKWLWWDLVPIPFRETLFSPIVRAITGEFGQSAYALPSLIGTGVRIGKGVNDVFETGNWRKLRNEMLKYGPGVFHPFGLGIPGGVQWSRMVDAIITYSSGGLTDRRGRVMFEMKDPKDLARAMFTGVWTTKEAQALLKKRRGKKKKPKPEILVEF